MQKKKHFLVVICSIVSKTRMHPLSINWNPSGYTGDRQTSLNWYNLCIFLAAPAIYDLSSFVSVVGCQ